MKNDKSYFKLYDDRYHRLKEQGIEDWISNPEDLFDVFRQVDEFLNYAHCNHFETSVIEFGCGQGHLAEYLINKGYRYFGVDISESAIIHARIKAGVKGQNAFLLTDITNLHQIEDSSYDAAIDNQCFHMLITDEHRKKYLAGVKRVLKNAGRVFFRESYRPEEFTAKISSLQEFIKANHGGYTTLHDYPAYIDGKQKIIRLPRIPARAKNERGYRRELEQAGFEVDHFSVEGMYCIIHAHV